MVSTFLGAIALNHPQRVRNSFTQMLLLQAEALGPLGRGRLRAGLCTDQATGIGTLRMGRIDTDASVT